MFVRIITTKYKYMNKNNKRSFNKYFYSWTKWYRYDSETSEVIIFNGK